MLIIGGGIVGSTIACHLARDGRAGRVRVVERDASYAFGSTPSSVGGIRQQFGLPENVLMSRYGSFATLDPSCFTYQRAIDNAPLAETGIV